MSGLSSMFWPNAGGHFFASGDGLAVKRGVVEGFDGEAGGELVRGGAESGAHGQNGKTGEAAVVEDVDPAGEVVADSVEDADVGEGGHLAAAAGGGNAGKRVGTDDGDGLDLGRSRGSRLP